MRQFSQLKIVASWYMNLREDTQPAFISSKLKIETLKQGVKYVQS